MNVNVGHLDETADNRVEAVGHRSRSTFRLSLDRTNADEKVLLGNGLPSCKDAHLWHA